MDPMTIGDAIREAREDAGLTQTQLAKSTGLSQARVSALERSERDATPSLQQIEVIEDALRLRRGALLQKAGWFQSDEEAEEFAAAAGDLAADLSPEDRELALGFLRQLRDRGRQRRP